MARLADLLNTAAGFSGNHTDVLTRSANLQKAGILPPGARKRGTPQIETVHAVSLLLAMLKAGPQIEAAQAAIELWHMPVVGSRLNPDQAPYALTHPRTFGQIIASFLETGADPDPEVRARLADLFVSAGVTRDLDHAQIDYGDGHTLFFQGSAKQKPGLNHLAGTIATATAAGPVTIGILADLVRRSRDEAARLNVAIPTEEAFRALRFPPTGGPGSSSTIPGVTAPLPIPMGLKTTTAEKPASSSAVAGQTALAQPCPLVSRHGIARDTHTQDVCVSERSDPSVTGDVDVAGFARDGTSASGISAKDSPDARHQRPHSADRIAA